MHKSITESLIDHAFTLLSIAKLDMQANMLKLMMEPQLKETMESNFAINLLTHLWCQLQFLGPIFLRCTIKDKNDLVFNGVPFCLIF